MTTNTDLHVAMPELLPCPFCGGTNIGGKLREGYSRFVMCGDCGAQCADVDTLPELDCVVAWNRRAAIQQAAVPEGFQIVPIEPTPEMIEAAHFTMRSEWSDPVGHFVSHYKAMLAASPAPPKQQPALGRGEGGGVPLSDAQISKLIHAKNFAIGYSDLVCLDWYRLGLRDGEAAHGIGKAPTGQINPDSAGQGLKGGE